MKTKKLYYTIEKEVYNCGDDEDLTGNKVIIVYDIVNNEPKKVTDLFCGNEENSKDIINKYLEHCYDISDEIELILL